MKPAPAELYDSDYYAWIEAQVRALRDHQIEDVDWENLAEEIDDLGKNEKHSIESHLETLVEHLLKLAYTPGTVRSRNIRLSEGTAKLARSKIRRRLALSPSLRSRMGELFESAYEDGRIRMLARVTLAERTVPTTAPWTLEQVMDDSFMPKPAD